MVSPKKSARVNTLYRAARRGDWKAIKTLLSLDKKIACIGLTENEEGILHIAATAKQTAFFHNIVKYLDTSDLELQDKNGNTAFCFAAASGVVEIAKVMYEKNKNLPTIRSSLDKTPLEMAILLRKRKMAEYLYTNTDREFLTDEDKKDIFLESIRADMYDIPLQMLKKEDPKILTENIEMVLKVLARKPLPYNHRSQGWIWERLVSIITTIPYIPYFKMRRQARDLVKELCKPISKLQYSDIRDLINRTQIFQDAVKVGNVEFLTFLTRLYPDLIWEAKVGSHSMFHAAVINRQEKVFSLIYLIGADKDLIVRLGDEKCNILHLAGKIAPPSRLNIVSGAALQMQRELLWFKEVEKNVPISFIDPICHHQTPRELFSKEHKELRDDGEKWMKETASSCMLVATLIVTVAFAAAFTVPGGNNEIGTPVFLKNRWFTVFVISDAVAMFSSATSIMIFLSILTSRYTEDDFLISLPAKLMFGLFSLFASIFCMVLTFTATFFLVYNEEKHGPLPSLVASLAWLPITIYAVLIYRLGIALIKSTCWPDVLMFRPGKHRLYE